MTKCYRCGGVMIYEKFYGDCEYFFGWKCITCGEIVDQVILHNRRFHHRFGPDAFPISTRRYLVR